MLQADLEKARGESRVKDEQIRVLKNELEKLKKIDMEKRPSKPPKSF